MSDGGHPERGIFVSGRFPELDEALCARVADLRRSGGLEPLAVVVGSAAVRTRVGDLLVRELGAVANVAVVTLGRFAADLVAGADGAPPAVVAEFVRERLVAGLVAARRDELAYFGPVADRPHFPQALAATFADLREARVEPGAPWSDALAEAAGASGDAAGRDRARDKARDLAALYRAYCDALAALAVTDRAGVELAAARAAAARPPAGHVILFGIYDLNGAQETLVEALVATGADIFAPVPRGGDREVAAVLAVGARLGLSERVLEPPAPAADRDLLAGVWRAGDGREAAPSPAGDGGLDVVSVPDERVELREAVRTVVAAIEQGVSSWQCAVVVPHGDDVALAAAALRDAGLPVACRLPDRAAGPRVLLALADVVAPPTGEPFARRAVIDLLAAAPLRGAGEAGETALWLDEARQAGVVAGRDQWAPRLSARRAGLERRVADLETRGAAEPDADDEVSDKVGTARTRLAAARGLEAAAARLARAADALPPRATWQAWAAELAGVVAQVFEPAVAEEAADAAGRLEALSLVDEGADLAEAAAALRESLAGARAPVGRVARDGVAVLTPLELRGLSFHTVAFTGLAEGGFPARGRPDPLLGDAERRAVGSALGMRLPLAEQRDAESLVVFAFACEAARERLVLLAPRSTASDGRPRLPSRLLLRLASLWAGRPIGLDDFLAGEGLTPVWRRVSGAPRAAEGVVWVDERERDTATLLSLSGGRRTKAAWTYAAAVLGDAEAAARRRGAWRSGRSPVPSPWDGLLGPEGRQALAARHPFDGELSPTRFERYIGCPFAFLLRDVFGLEAPDEPDDSLEMDAREFGTLAHAILQRVYERVVESGLDGDAAHLEVAAAWEECCAAAERRGVTGAALSWEVRREMLREDLLESVRRDPVFRGAGSRPVEVEWRFGEAAGRPVTLALPGGRVVSFRGRLDRVDETPSGARVIDYKTGRGETERDRLKERLSVQLPVYRLAVRQAGATEYPAIACLYRLVTRRGGFQDLDLPQDEDDSGRRLTALVADAVALVDAGLFPRSSRQGCRFCDVGYACGVAGWVRERKRAHESLEAVVRLQAPASAEVADGD